MRRCGSALFALGLAACLAGCSPRVTRGCRYIGTDDATAARTWDCPGGNGCRQEVGGEIRCYRTPPSGTPVPYLPPPGCPEVAR